MEATKVIDKVMLKQEILEKVAEYYKMTVTDRPFIPGQTLVNFGGTVAGVEEYTNLMDEGLIFWMAAGQWTRKFEEKAKERFGSHAALIVNSGSSANLLAFTTLTSWKLGDRQIKKGDEVITTAAGFPTTVTPIIQYGAVPVFVDINLDTLNIDVNQMRAALTPKTKAVMVAHTLGNPCDIFNIQKFCKDNNLWLILDCCDAAGGYYKGKPIESYGDITTHSYYPPHMMTCGEGGCVFINNPELHKIAWSIRNWGKACWCPPGVDNACGKRHTGKHGDLPEGYDHKYVIDHLGYNLKATDMQAAILCAQLEKLDGFVAKRRDNWVYLRRELEGLPIEFMECTLGSSPAHFGFTMIVRDRKALIEYMEKAKIQTRTLFMGNMIKQPAFVNQPELQFRVASDLKNTDIIMNDLMWFGCYPGISEEMLEYIVKTIRAFYGK